MRLTFRPAFLVAVLFVLIVWFFRYEEVTRTLEGVSCTERVNRYTRDRCLVSDEVAFCRKVISSRPCD
ncbi:MAG TPA: hypothetical protein VK973_11680 [Arenicellales bacterium]|nr:hypothetical protein [Arenicellales bacterium]